MIHQQGFVYIIVKYTKHQFHKWISQACWLKYEFAKRKSSTISYAEWKDLITEKILNKLSIADPGKLIYIPGSLTTQIYGINKHEFGRN